jgi:hypothetical protein
MKRVQVIYELGETVLIDEVVAEYVNVRVLPGRRATVKTATQSAHYSKAGRVLIDENYDGPPMPFTRTPVTDR